MSEHLIISRKERVLVVITALFLFVTSGFIIQAASKYSKNKNDELKLKVQVIQANKKNPEFNLQDLNWISYSTSTIWGNRDSHTAYIFNNKMWVVGGLDANNSIENGEPNYDKAIYFNDVWSTNDGINWTREIEHANFPPIRSVSVFEVNGKLFMLGGYSPDPKVYYKTGLWTSTDGVNWTKENVVLPWKVREGQKVIKFKDQYLMIGGVNYGTRERFNDVWSSTDGYNWSLVTKAAAWDPRWDMEITEFNGKLWLTGGMTSVPKLFGDEWVSDDGANWKLVYENAPFGKRQGHASIVSNGYLMLIGGITETVEKPGEVWITNDGLKWERQINKWDAREDVSALVFKRRIWILGGMNYNYVWTNEILHSDYRFFDGQSVNEKTLISSITNQNTTLYTGKCPQSTSTISSEILSITFVNRDTRLQEGFIPRNLVNLDSVIKTDGGVCLDKLAAENLIAMFKAAEKENIFLGVNYGYRSPEKQQEMFDFWVKQSGLKEATEGIAKPYYSEHQLGMAVDLSGKTINYLGVSKSFAQTEEAKWLDNNAYLYGFTLSYPENKTDLTGYIYEPWHYRYVGNTIAKILHESKMTFSEYQKKSN